MFIFSVVIIVKNLQENVVPSSNQNQSDVYVYGNGGFKVMFVGNSITKHSPKPSINWFNDCGMAATKPENDYVHLIVEKIKREYRPDVSYCITQVANFERAFSKEIVDELYPVAKDFKPDIIIMFFGANVSKDYDDDKKPSVKFGEAYEYLRNYLCSKNENAIVFHSEGFYIRPVLDSEKKAVAEKYGDSFITLGDIRDKEDTHGMYNHPNDKGMKEIAEKFWAAIKSKLK